MLTKLFYFGSNKKSIALLNPAEYTPNKRPFTGYKPEKGLLGLYFEF